jgi:hypothetical protein
LEQLIIQEELSGKRLDLVVSLLFPELTRAHAQKLIKEGAVSVDEKPRKPAYAVTAGELLAVELPEPEVLEVLPEDIPLDILYEDSDVILVNKPKGMVVHPAAGHASGTLVNALLYHCRDSLSGINGILRPGIVHRIDKDTTGVIIACKNDRAHQCIAAQLKEHSITRRYFALAQGVIREDEGTVDAPLGRDPENRKKMKSGLPGGKHAVTHYRVLERFSAASYLSCSLETGRTHQIRVHLASLGHPLLGDTVYGSQKNPYHLEGQCLHAAVLGFRHPADGRYLEFSAPLPDYFEELLRKLRKKA